MEWQKDIWLQGKQIQIFRYKDACTIKVVKSIEEKICCINSQQTLKIFNLENLQMEKKINQSEIMAYNIFRFYQPLYLSDKYLYNQGYILNIETEQKYSVEYDYTLDYVDEENIYGYRIIRKKDYNFCLQVQEFDNFGQTLQKIYEENYFQNDNFLISKHFIIVQQPSFRFKIFITKKQKKLGFQIKNSNFKNQIISLENNQLMFITQDSHHTIKLSSQLKLIRRISKFPNFNSIIGSLCLGIKTCNNNSQTRLLYYDYISFQSGEIDEVFNKGSVTCAGNTKCFSFTLDDQLHVLKFK